MLECLYKGKQIELQLQTYFIEKHFDAAKRFEDRDHVVDRDIIEHWLFAQKNIKDPVKMASYEMLYVGFFYIQIW